MTATPVPNERTRLITYGESQGDGFGGAAHHQHQVVGLGDHDDPDTDDTHLQVGGHHHHDGAPDDPNSEYHVVMQLTVDPGSGRGRLGTTKAVAKKIRQRSKYYVPVSAEFARRADDQGHRMASRIQLVTVRLDLATELTSGLPVMCLLACP